MIIITLILYKPIIMCGLDSSGIGWSPPVGCLKHDNESPGCANIQQHVDHLRYS